MQIYQPNVNVVLIKALPRKDVLPGVAVEQPISRIKQMDLTPYLGEGGAIHVSKSIRQPAGTFVLSFADNHYPYETLYALIEPMDLIEIRIGTGISSDMHLIMRGFVSQVDKAESMPSGNPRRLITVSGHDYGKILQMIQILYLPLAVSDQYFLDWLKWAQNYAGHSAIKMKSAAEFISDVLTDVINPFLNQLVLSAEPVGDNHAVINTIKNGTTDVQGSISAYAPNQFTDVTLMDMLKTLLDAPLFNELYTEDHEDSVNLVVRPTPFKRLSTGDFIQGHAETRVLQTVDILNQKVSRSDASVANFFWVNHHFTQVNQQDLKLIALQGDKDSFIKFDYLNCLKKKFAIRKMEVVSWLLAPDYPHSDSPKEAQYQDQKTSLEHWVLARRQLLTDLSMDNSILESGSLTVRGDPLIKAGTYLTLYHGNHYQGEVYAHTVSHDFSPFKEYTTRIDFDRGTLFFEQIKA